MKSVLQKGAFRQEGSSYSRDWQGHNALVIWELPSGRLTIFSILSLVRRVLRTDHILGDFSNAALGISDDRGG